MNYFLCILYSESRNRFYIGSSGNPKERLNRHNAGATKSTKSCRPWKIVYTEQYKDKTDAIKRENYLKRMKSRIMIEKIINGSLAG